MRSRRHPCGSRPNPRPRCPMNLVRTTAFSLTIGLLVAGTVGLWLGRRGAPGSLKAVVQDFQLMMIGPAWLLSLLYRRFRIPY